MTQDLAAALLKDVPRHTIRPYVDDLPCLLEKDVLAALSCALDPALLERAGEVLEQLGLFVKPQWSTGAPAYVCTAARDLITALLTQIAWLKANVEAGDLVNGLEKNRAEAAEAREERLRGALERIKADDQHQSEWRYWEKEDGYFAKIARAALTETATTEERK